MATVTSSYIKGLDQDTAISKRDNESLYYGLNLDLVTDLGTSTGVIHNHKGNKLDFTLPSSIHNIYSLTITDLPVGSVSGVITTTNTEFPQFNITISSFTTIQDIYNQLISQLGNNTFVTIQYNNNNIVFVNNEDSYGYFLDPILQEYLSIRIKVNRTDDPVIIGWTMLNEGIVLFTTQKRIIDGPNFRLNDSPNPNGTTGQIWLLEYNDVLDEVTGLVNGVLDPLIHLKYNGVLNFSLYNAIYREAHGRYESSTKGNVYWTDNFNPPRVFNVYNPNGFAIDETVLDWKPGIKFSVPIIQDVLNVGSLKVGSYQFTYRLKTNDGGITQFSPYSKLINITEDKESNTYVNYDGTESGITAGKSIKFRVSDIDMNFDTIEFAFVSYEVKDVPLIYTFKELPITSNVIDVIFTGNEPKVALSISEATNPRINFDTVKTFTQKKNRLYPANTTSRKFDVIGYDTRAYRFNSTGSYLLYSKNGNSITGLGLDLQLTNLPDNHDAVNPYNDDSGTVYGLLGSVFDFTRDGWKANYQYAYQTDGTTFGGEGINVSYSIISESYQGVKQWNTTKYSSPFVTIDNNPSTIVNLGIENQDYNIKGFNGIKNIFLQEIYKSHQVGEVYRYGLVFHNEKGEESFVNWIGDIRIPEPHESSNFELSYTDGNNVMLRTFFIQFELKNINVLLSNNPGITGIHIVRKQRDTLNKKRFGNGILMSPTKAKIRISGDTGGTDPGTDVILLTRLQNENNITGDTTVQDAIVTDALGFPFHKEVMANVDDKATYQKALSRFNFDFDNRLTNFIYGGRLPVLKSPEIDFNYYNNEATHYTVLNRYNWHEGSYWGRMVSAADPNLAHAKSSRAFYVFLGNTIDTGRPLYSEKVIDINKQQIVDIESVVPSAFSSFMTDGDYHHVGYYRRRFVDGGLQPGGGETYFNTLAAIGSRALFTEVNGTKLESNNGGDYKQGPGSTNMFNRSRINLVALSSYNFGQYGGPWRETRYQDIYISASEFVPINVLNNPQEIKVSGDVFTTYYTSTMTFMHWKQAGDTNQDYDQSTVPGREPTGLGAIYDPVRAFMQSLVLGFPVQTMINTEMRYGKYWNKDQVSSIDNPDFALFLVDEYTDNTAYSQENNIKTFISKPFNINFTEEQPFTVWVSQNKLEGEIVDSWRTYLINDQKSVEGSFGPINKIVNFKENIIAYQNRGITRILSEEISSMSNDDGQVFQIGIGNVLVGYEYLSKDTGSIHQHAISVAPDTIYHFDARLKKMFAFKGGLSPLSDIKGLNSYFKKEMVGRVLQDDLPLLSRGIHCEYDSKYNKVYYTFGDSFKVTNIRDTDFFPIFPPNIGDLFSFNNITIENGDSLVLNKVYTINGIQFKLITITPNMTNWNITLMYLHGTWSNINYEQNEFFIDDKFTIAYNNFIDAYESFYSFIPTLYLGTGKRLLSGNPYDLNHSVYAHNKGNYSKFYDLEIPFETIAQFFVNVDGTSKMTFRTNYFEFWSQLFDENENDIFNESITGLTVTNDYQSTEESLDPLNNITMKRFERTWRINLIRDYLSPNPLKPYLRDKYIKVNLRYNNQNNYKFTLHNWNTDITLSYPVTQ